MPLLKSSILPADPRQPAIPSTGIAGQLGAGFAAGILDTPLVGGLIGEAATFLPNITEEDVRRVIAAGESTPLARGTKFATEIGVGLAAGSAAYAGGRMLAGAALAAASEGATGGALAPAAAFFADTAGSLAPITKVPGIVRGVQALGGALGVGALGAAQEATKPQATPGDIAKAFGIGAGSTIAIEGLVAGVGAGAKRLGLLKEPPTVARVQELTSKSAYLTDETLAAMKGRELQIRGRIATILGSDRQAAALAQRADPQLPLFGDALLPPKAPRGAALPQMELFEQPTARLGQLSLTARQERAFLTAQKQLRRARTAREAYQRYVQEPIPIMAMRGSQPLNPDENGLLVQKALIQFAKAPETTGRELGPAGVKLVQFGQEAEAIATMGKSSVRARLVRLRNDAAQAMGVSAHTARKSGEWFAPAVEAYERGGIDGVRTFNDKLVPIFSEIDDYMRTQYGTIAKLGGEPLLSQNDMTKLGVRAFFPQVVDFDQVGKDAFRKRFAEAIARKTGRSIEEATLSADSILSKQLRGLRQFGSIDYQRALPGTTLDKITNLGLPLTKDPWHALERYASALERRIAFGSRFGFKGELRDPMVAAIAAQGGNRELASTVADVFLSRKFYDGAMSRWANNIVNAQMGAKLPLSAIANASQSVNTAFMFGMRRTAKNMVTALAKEHSDDVLRGAALGESIVQGMRDPWLEPSANTIMGRFANFSLTAGGFTKVERYNRIVGGATAEAAFLDDTMRGAAGRLRGNNLLIARRRWGALGMDFDKIVREAKDAGFEGWATSAAGKKSITQAVFAGARATQFISSPSRMPLFWQHPVGRVMMQFHSFSFNQAKFLRDAVLNEAASGNYKPLAGFLSLYPVVGDMVGDVRSLATGREPREFDGMAAYLDNFMYTGGIGLASDAYMAARYGRLEGFILGPTVSDAGMLLERLAQGNVDGLLSDLRRQPIVTAAGQVYTLAGSGVALGAGAAQRYLDSGTKGD